MKYIKISLLILLSLCSASVFSAKINLSGYVPTQETITNQPQNNSALPQQSPNVSNLSTVSTQSQQHFQPEMNGLSHTK